MPAINDWNKLNEEDKKLILNFTASNSAIVREMMRNKFPSLYIGRMPEEVARGWLMIAGLSEVKDYILSRRK